MLDSVADCVHAQKQMLNLVVGFNWTASLVMPLSVHLVNKPSPYELI